MIKGKTHSSGKLLYSARIIPYRGSWLDFEFDAKNLIYARVDRRRKLPCTIILRALGFSQEEILDKFFDKRLYQIKDGKLYLKFDAAHLRGEIIPFDLYLPSNKKEPLVQANNRVTVRHIRLLEKEGMEFIEVQDPVYLEGQTLAKDIIDTSTGELLFESNTLIDSAFFEKITENAISEFEVIYTNDLDSGSYISDTLRIDPTKSTEEALIEIYKMMRPGEPPTQEASSSLFSNLFFIEERYDLSQVGRMKFNRRLKRVEVEGSSVLDKERYFSGFKIFG